MDSTSFNMMVSMTGNGLNQAANSEEALNASIWLKLYFSVINITTSLL